jgi:hypothetical protein
MELKDGRNYWTDAEHVAETSFLIGDLPEDRRVVVDGHTTSPVFSDEHAQLIMMGVKTGLVDKESAIEMLPFQNKDTLLQRIRDKEKKEAELMAKLERADPQGFAKAVEKQIGGHRR